MKFLPGKLRREKEYAASDATITIPVTTQAVYTTLLKKYTPKFPFVQAMAKLWACSWAGMSALSTKMVSLVMNAERTIQKIGNRQVSITANKNRWMRKPLMKPNT